MPRFYDFLADDDKPGHLIVDTRCRDYVEVFYALSRERVKLWKNMYDEEERHCVAPPYRVKILQIDARNHQFTMIPIKTRLSSPELLTAKYEQVKRITIVDKHLTEMQNMPSTQDAIMILLEDLSPCFVKDFDYGLGLVAPYRCIVDAVEQLSDCSEILISEDNITSAEENSNVFHISAKDLEAIRKSINRTMKISQVAARSVKHGTTYNFLATKLGRPHTSIPTGRSPLRRHITNSALGKEEPLSDEEQEVILTLVARNTESIVKSGSDKLASLQRDIELVTLDNLIEQFETNIKKNLPEGVWQAFLNENPFILSLAFGFPIIKVHDQASVGGRKIVGGGAKIADFLVKNSMTQNAAIIEIKTPHTKLLNRKQVSRGVYTPSGELVGAISQTLDQKNHFEHEIAQIKVNSRIYDMESYSVHCCLIVGKVPSDEDRLRSFELFRGNSKDVEIITFDELMEKLRQLREFLNSPEPELGDRLQSFEPPF